MTGSSWISLPLMAVLSLQRRTALFCSLVSCSNVGGVFSAAGASRGGAGVRGSRLTVTNTSHLCLANVAILAPGKRKPGEQGQSHPAYWSQAGSSVITTPSFSRIAGISFAYSACGRDRRLVNWSPIDSSSWKKYMIGVLGPFSRSCKSAATTLNS